VTNVDQQTDATRGQADEDILTYGLSDEALEAAAGTDRGAFLSFTMNFHYGPPCC
jgi:hypothetical protein